VSLVRSKLGLTEPIFVRFVWDIKLLVFVLRCNNVLEWKMRVLEVEVKN
jgi:hypothetical protein